MLNTIDGPQQIKRPRHHRSPLSPASNGARPVVSRKAIEQAVIQVFGVGPADLHHTTRGRAKVALARQVAMYLAHVACGLSLTDTGRLFGRDRTTAAHACTVVEDKRDDPHFDGALDLLEWAVSALATRPSTRSFLCS
jgi:hypothetical protein